jgi:hypothetical protein
MTVRDKLEIGLDPDAGHRHDNVPPEQRPEQAEKIEQAEAAALRRKLDEPKLIPKEDRREVEK